VKQKEIAQEHCNRLCEIRQALYENGFKVRRDALFECLDTVTLSGPAASFPMLSQYPWFRRKWPSLYGAVEDGQLDVEWLQKYLIDQVPLTGRQVFALDSTSWIRPRAEKMADRQYVYQATSDVDGGNVGIGYPYSLLDWVEKHTSSWSLSVDVQRVPSTKSALEVGAEQVKILHDQRPARANGEDVIAADSKYSAPSFLRQVKKIDISVVVRLWKNRVLYYAPRPEEQLARGRKRKYGARFDFKDATTWGEPAETQRFTDTEWGQVQIERWKQLRIKGAADISLDVLRISTHLERDKRPEPIWLGWQADTKMPECKGAVIWNDFRKRWPIEPNIRFRKQRLGWTQPQFHQPETGDTWSWIVALAVWQLHWSRSWAPDSPLPWQKKQGVLTPQRVQQSLPFIFGVLGTPAQPPKRRGNAPGWPEGRERTPRERQKVVRKPQKRRKRRG